MFQKPSSGTNFNPMISLISQHRSELASLCRRFKARRLAVFGSAASGEFDDDRSDLDFVVSLNAKSPVEYADNFFGLAQGLEDLFQRKVDLITEPSIRNPHFREEIRETQQLVYES